MCSSRRRKSRSPVQTAEASATTDGTHGGLSSQSPAAGSAAEYLAGRSPGVMTQYGGGLFGAEQHLHSREPAPDEDKSGVLQLVEWREEAPYG